MRSGRLAVVILVVLGAACSMVQSTRVVGFTPFATPMLANPFSQSTQIIVRAPGTGITTGAACANSVSDGSSIGIEGNHPLPTATTRATVYLNGWYLKYRNGDHHVARLRATILNVRQESNTLRWLAAGWLTDSGFDKTIADRGTCFAIIWPSSVYNLSLSTREVQILCSSGAARRSGCFLQSVERTDPCVGWGDAVSGTIKVYSAKRVERA
jgi:hypothetical protein